MIRCAAIIHYCRSHVCYVHDSSVLHTRTSRPISHECFSFLRLFRTVHRLAECQRLSTFFASGRQCINTSATEPRGHATVQRLNGFEHQLQRNECTSNLLGDPQTVGTSLCSSKAVFSAMIWGCWERFHSVVHPPSATGNPHTRESDAALPPAPAPPQPPPGVRSSPAPSPSAPAPSV